MHAEITTKASTGVDAGYAATRTGSSVRAAVAFARTGTEASS